MALEIRQQLKLSQQLVMTPQLQQAIKLLQLSRMELMDVVRQELEENPVLEEGQETSEEKADVEAESPTAEEPSSQELTEVKGDNEGASDIDWQTYLESYSLGGSTADNYEADEERPSYENLLTRKPSLQDHLLWQLNMSRLEKMDRQIACELIGNIDEGGYLQVSAEEIAEQIAVDVQQVERVLNALQEFDPVGVCSRNLQECLLRQVQQLDMENSLVDQILRDHLGDLENRRYPAIARALHVSVDEVYEAAKLISNLDPRPGSQYGQEETHYISPDIFVHKVGDEYIVVLNDEGLPNLRINSFYRNALSGTTKVDEEAGEYIQDKLRGALWLIKSIHQRQRTIYKVTTSIVKYQRDFFDRGPSYLKPLVLRDVAEDIGMHESTVSRVTTNKYVQTPQGLFELKFFFNSGIHTTGGDSVASESVKIKIKEIIAGENERKPYSDQKIVELLKEQGIDIARRTVTKYREMLNIGSSTQRKRLF
ncbi:MAG TPA: RNA polymerase factor sigma-54 [Desulfuromonadales bacterium]|nr:RNA polymerase factor sigma-54 [Desulfuromonadales bacterium]HKL49083.1 RNA polymerase factor sigma-54 [Desulfuromonadales bacterium]